MLRTILRTPLVSRQEISRKFGTIKKPTCKTLVVEPLKERELIKVEGPDSVEFLQGLMTNDMKHLTEYVRPNAIGCPAMYTLFLHKNGRILYESIIYRAHTPDTFLIECDRSVADELQRHLEMYRVRRKISVDVMSDIYKPWVVFDPEDNVNEKLLAKRLGSDMIFATDPRIRGFGMRFIVDANQNWKDFAKTIKIPSEISTKEPTDTCNYRYHRYCYGVGEGIRDIPPGKSIPLEMNGDYLNGISFQKGCYIGQELTARTQHTGVVRKRLMPLVLTNSVPMSANTIQTESFTKAGTLRGVCKDRGLAILRLEYVLKEPKLLIDGDPCYVEKPRWWPKELPNKSALAENV